jgi:predicted ester cyclase
LRFDSWRHDRGIRGSNSGYRWSATAPVHYRVQSVVFHPPANSPHLARLDPDTYGTHKSEFGGISPTDRLVTMTGIAVYRFDRGRIVEAWSNSDSLGTLRQLGVVP